MGTPAFSKLGIRNVDAISMERRWSFSAKVNITGMARLSASIDAPRNDRASAALRAAGDIMTKASTPGAATAAHKETSPPSENPTTAIFRPALPFRA